VGSGQIGKNGIEREIKGGTTRCNPDCMALSNVGALTFSCFKKSQHDNRQKQQPIEGTDVKIGSFYIFPEITGEVTPGNRPVRYETVVCQKLYGFTFQYFNPDKIIIPAQLAIFLVNFCRNCSLFIRLSTKK
jgi:hypothetical protein